MRILFFVDTHGSDAALRKLKEKARSADIIVCAGDFTVFETDMQRILRDFDSLGKPLLIIHGNHETASSVIEQTAGLKNITFIHKSIYEKDDLVFFGYGGGGFSITDPKFDRAAEDFLKDLENLRKKNKKEYKTVLVLHAPPYGTALDDLGDHVGCKNFTKFIKEHQPILSVSGHIHENAGRDDRIGKTLLVNPGPQGKIIELK